MASIKKENQQNQTRFSKFEIFIGACTLFLSIVCSVGAVSYFCGSQLTTVTSSIDSLKGELQETNLTLKQLRNDNIGFKISNAEVKKDITSLDSRVTKLENKDKK